MISENERHYAEMVLGVIDTVECPMLMCEGEKMIVRKALKAYINNNDTADTPQTDCETCKYGQDKHRYAHICNECGVGINNYTPQTETQMKTKNSNLTFEKSDCPWK